MSLISTVSLSAKKTSDRVYLILSETRKILSKKFVFFSHWTATAELAAAQEKQMEVCEVCGAFLIVGDAQQRIDDHLMGKQHMG